MLSSLSFAALFICVILAHSNTIEATSPVRVIFRLLTKDNQEKRQWRDAQDSRVYRNSEGCDAGTQAPNRRQWLTGTWL